MRTLSSAEQFALITKLKSIWEKWLDLKTCDWDLKLRLLKQDTKAVKYRLINLETGRVITDYNYYSYKDHTNYMIRIYLNSDIEKGYFQLNVFKRGKDWQAVTSFTDNKFTIIDLISIEDFLETFKTFYKFSKEGVL